MVLDRAKSSALTTGALQRAAIACQSCRQRKIKCDAQSVGPGEGCGPCRRAGQECLLDPLSDGRRTVSRKYVDELQQRIETLEALNQRTVGQPASGAADDATTLPASDSSLLPCGTMSTTSIVGARTQSPHRVGDSILSRASYASHQAPSASALIVEPQPSKAIRHGSPSFYGATSHPHVVSPGDESHVDTVDESDGVGIEVDPANPHLRDQLLQSFLKYQSLWVDIVDRESFVAHKADGSSSRWYSSFLENAMLACGARLSTSRSVRALASKYCAWAKDEAMSAMSDPTPASLQGFLLLSEYEVSQGNDRQGWMFCGVACRMLSDLGLHELANIISPPKEPLEPTRESDLAYALLSACIVYEGVWTIYLGRPSSIPKSILNVAASRCRAGRKSDSLWLNAWVGLCVPMAEISHILNEHSLDDLDRSVSLRKLLHEVETWYETLPSELKYEDDHLASLHLNGYGLHSQYCKVQILLRRSLFKPTNARKRRRSVVGLDHDINISHDCADVMIYKYALRTARLVVTYREVFGMEKIPSIMLDNAVVAATAMIRHFNDTIVFEQLPPETGWLRQLVRSLELVQPHFPIVGRMLDSLKQICGNGPLRSILPFIRRDSTGSSLGEMPQYMNFNPRADHAHVNVLPTEENSDFPWNTLDAGFSAVDFAPSAFDSLGADLASPDVLMSSFAQAVL